MPEQRAERVPEAMRPTYEAIVAMTDSFCTQYLNDEYAGLCRQLAAALARKRPSPLARGRPDMWACGIVYALGSVNFLFDESQVPHMRADELCAAFGINKNSGANKGRMIRDLFGMTPFDPDWCLPSLMEEDPRVWLLEVNGVLMDVRYLPREIQELAFRQGLIPYIPADREGE